MASIKTVSVVSNDPEHHNGEPFTINEEDFNPEAHRHADDASEEAEGSADVGTDVGKAKGKLKK